jgi:hypothetical protein
MNGQEKIPVRMFWKASSTLLASRAEVSIKERLFSPTEGKSARGSPSAERLLHTCELLGFLCRNSSQVSQITLVSNEHDDDIRVCVVSQLFEPSCDVFICLMLAYIIY